MRCTPSASTTDRIGGQSLGHRGDGERHADEQHVDEVGRGCRCPTVSRIAPMTTTAIDDHRDAEHAADRGRPPAAAACAAPRYCRAGARCCPSRSPCPVAVTTARPRPRVTAVPPNTMFTRSPSAGRRVERRDVLQHRLALARQRRLGDRQRRRLHEPRVGADRVALGEQQDVAGHHLGGGDRAARARRARPRPSAPPSAAARRPPARPAPPARSRAPRSARRSPRSRSPRTAPPRRPRPPKRRARPQPRRAGGR